VQAARGKPGQSVVKTQPYPLTDTNWSIEKDGRNLTVTARNQHFPPNAVRPERIADGCVVQSLFHDDAVVAAMQRWVAVFPDTAGHRGDQNRLQYSFEGTNSGHAQLPRDPAAYSVIETAGRIWYFTLFWSPQSDWVELDHVVATVPAAK